MNLPSRYQKLPMKFAGGMSSALLYNDTHLDRQVIVKVLKSGVDQKRLVDEIRALSSVRSKHVVAVFDLVRNKAGDIRAVIVEFLSGDLLSSKVGKCSTEQILLYALAISRGVEDIHAVDQIHRDIKPDNIRFDAESCLKIFDFGLSRPDDIEATTTDAVGTLGYMAPELLVEDDETAYFTKAIDVFAFGATMLHLIRGTLPAGLRKVPMKLPCAEADFSNQTIVLPSSVADVLNSCLAANPNNRPSISEVRSIVQRHILFNQHRASLIVSGKPYYLQKNNPTVKVNSGSRGGFTIQYDGLFFQITEAAGSVYVTTSPSLCPNW